MAIGNPKIRKEWFTKLKEAGFELPSLISDKAFITPSSDIVEGAIIEEMVVVKTAAKVECGSIISSGAVVNYNTIVKDFCHIDCNAVVGAGAIVPKSTHLNYGQVVMKTNTSENWSFSE